MSPITLKKADKSAFFSELDWQSNDRPSQAINNRLTATEVTADQNNHVKPPSTDQGTTSLIDIGTPSPLTTMPPAAVFDFHQNQDLSSSTTTTAYQATTTAHQEELIDPFAGLATSRSNVSPKESMNDILLNFNESSDTGSKDTSSKGLFQSSPDLISSTTNTNKRIQSPDIVPNHATAGISSEDLTNDDDFFGELNSAFANNNTTCNSSQPEQSSDPFMKQSTDPFKQPTDPFMKHHHQVPKKSSSESNLLDINESLGGSASDTLIPETQPLHHSASSGSVADSGRSASYDPFGDLGSFSSTSSSTFGNHRQQPVAPGKSSSARNSPTFNKQPMQQQQQQQQQSRQNAPNYNVFVSGNTESVFKKNKSTGGWGKFVLCSDSFTSRSPRMFLPAYVENVFCFIDEV